MALFVPQHIDTSAPPVDEMTAYCRAIRSCPNGQVLCDRSDLFGAKSAIERGESTVYRCGGYVYDFAIPIKNKQKKSIGAFVDGQLRPRIIAWDDLSLLCLRHNLDENLLDHYSEMSVLNHKKVRDISEFLQGDFSEKLSHYSSEISIDEFRRDVQTLSEKLYRAAGDGLMKQIWKPIDRSLDLKTFSATIPVLCTPSEEYSETPKTFFEISLTQPGSSPWKTSITTDTKKRIAETFKEKLSKFDETTVMSFSEDKYPCQMLNHYSSKYFEDIQAGSPSGKFKTGKWISRRVVNGEQIALLAVKAPARENFEEIKNALDESAVYTKSYLDRYCLARALTRAIGSPDVATQDRNKFFNLSIIKISINFKIDKCTKNHISTNTRKTIKIRNNHSLFTY